MRHRRTTTVIQKHRSAIGGHNAMRILPAVVALGAAVALSACTYVERERTVPARPAAVQTAPGATVVTPGVVAPAAPPAAVIVR
jgi:hypothetical protein